jgi:2,3-diaminopropionate biosynthesis protein SbnB
MHRDLQLHSRTLTILGADDVAAQLRGLERELIALAAQTYVTHGRGDTRLPQSEYLRFPGMARERIIPKAGYLGGSTPTCGIKWIASFPDNVESGMPRASALMVLNCVHTGRPTTVLEGSLISAQRTAAAAALAARLVHEAKEIGTLGVVGCGPISQETVRFLLADERPVRGLMLHDVDPERARAFAAHWQAQGFAGPITLGQSSRDVLARSELTVFGTSAVEPSVHNLSMLDPQDTVLHVSLRDLSVESVLQADNLADDIDHVLQANTSVHQTEQRLGRRDFMRATLADVIEGRAAPRVGGRPVVVHPFGLAALDLAFAQFVTERARRAGLGKQVADFLV